MRRLDKAAEDMSEGAAAEEQLQVQTSLTKHSLIILQCLQMVHQALAALRATVGCWQASGAAGVQVSMPTHTTIPPQQHLHLQQQQQQQQEQKERDRQEQRERQQCRMKLQKRQTELEDAQLSLQELERGVQRMLQQQPSSPQEVVDAMLQQLLWAREQTQQHLAELKAGCEQILLQDRQQQQIDHLEQAIAARALMHSIRLTARNRLQLSGCTSVACLHGLDKDEERYSADAMVAGLRGVRCGGCGLVRYCCPQHQKDDWPIHRRVCRRLAQARAAAGRAKGSSTASGGKHKGGGEMSAQQDSL
jgi:hypothetical protein